MNSFNKEFSSVIFYDSRFCLFFKATKIVSFMILFSEKKN